MTDGQNRGGSVRSMGGGPALVIERVDPTDAAATRVLASLRRAWVEERRGGPQDDPGFEDDLAAWWEREAPQRLAWVASVGDEPVGMLNLLEFTRMPSPGAPAGPLGLPRQRLRARRAPRPGHRPGHARRRDRRGPGAGLRAHRAQPVSPVGAVLPARRVQGRDRAAGAPSGSTAPSAAGQVELARRFSSSRSSSRSSSGRRSPTAS